MKKLSFFHTPFCFALYVASKNENEKGELDYEQEIFRTGRIIP